MTAIATLAQAYPPDHIYVAGIHPDAARWLGLDDTAREACSGGVLPLAGDVPVICHAGVATPAILDLLAAAGHSRPGAILAYRTPDDLLALIRRVVGEGRRLVFAHPLPPDLIPPAAEWMPRAVVTRLNNKAHLSELVSPAYVPRRAVHPGHRLAREVRPPVVLKVATESSTGGGADVRLCPTDAALAGAIAELNDCEHVVAEEWLPMRRSVCANVLVLENGELADIGVAEQRCDAAGRYLGNWLDETTFPTALAIARQVAAAGAARGYRGVVGVDIAMLPDGRLQVFDLNFRLNGCTAALVAYRRLAAPVAQLRSFVGTSDLGTMVRTTARCVADQLLLPLSAFDPTLAPHTHGAPRLRALVLGTSRRDVIRRIKHCRTLGLA